MTTSEQAVQPRVASGRLTCQKCGQSTTSLSCGICKSCDLVERRRLIIQDAAMATITAAYVDEVRHGKKVDREELGALIVAAIDKALVNFDKEQH